MELVRSPTESLSTGRRTVAARSATASDASSAASGAFSAASGAFSAASGAFSAASDVTMCPSSDAGRGVERAPHAVSVVVGAEGGALGASAAWCADLQTPEVPPGAAGGQGGASVQGPPVVQAQ
ncbi:hypothetical protein GCM10010145_46860 [Streptomyces ruber]|uniref:Uncharacterized protein n=2 Tax=Streptomyces TaxID=1883 RepID=A0A918BII4_9ACTN|nr:hypothetical protein GCM10010145_46860 [Streptomyces ruber]